MLECLITLGSYEIAIELLGIFDPSCTENFEGISLVRIVLTQETDVTLLLVLVPKVALEGILMLVDLVLERMAFERLFTVDAPLFIFMSDSIS